MASSDVNEFSLYELNKSESFDFDFDYDDFNSFEELNEKQEEIYKQTKVEQREREHVLLLQAELERQAELEQQAEEGKYYDDKIMLDLQAHFQALLQVKEEAKQSLIKAEAECRKGNKSRETAMKAYIETYGKDALLELLSLT